MLVFAIALFFGWIVCWTGPAWDEHRAKKRALRDFPAGRLLIEGKPCRTCFRTNCPWRD